MTGGLAKAVSWSLWPAPLPAPKPALCRPSQALCPAPLSALSVCARSGPGVTGLSLALCQAHPLTFHVEVPSVSGPAEWQQGPPAPPGPCAQGTAPSPPDAACEAGRAAVGGLRDVRLDRHSLPRPFVGAKLSQTSEPHPRPPSEPGRPVLIPHHPYSSFMGSPPGRRGAS